MIIMKNKSLIILCGLLAYSSDVKTLKFGDNFLRNPLGVTILILCFLSKNMQTGALNQFYKSLWDFYAYEGASGGAYFGWIYDIG